jgi:uncharacterized protein
MGVSGGTARAPIHRYSFPPQESQLRGGEDLHNVGGNKLGTADDISMEARWVDVKKRGDSVDVHPEAVFAHKVISAKVMAEALVRIGEYVAEHGMAGEGPYQAARDLLMRMPPRLDGRPIQKAGETTLNAALRIAPALGGGILPIQGPPGAGKTHTGTAMVCALVPAGKTVGVTANSHKVIRHFLDGVLKAAETSGVDIRAIHKPGEMEPDQARLRRDGMALVFARCRRHRRRALR